jgi:hypothetical protein
VGKITSFPDRRAVAASDMDFGLIMVCSVRPRLPIEPYGAGP